MTPDKDKCLHDIRGRLRKYAQDFDPDVAVKIARVDAPWLVDTILESWGSQDKLATKLVFAERAAKNAKLAEAVLIDRLNGKMPPPDPYKWYLCGVFGLAGAAMTYVVFLLAGGY